MSELTDVINATKDKGIFPTNAKLASVKPIYRKGSRLDVSNYRPISVGGEVREQISSGTPTKGAILYQI